MDRRLRIRRGVAALVVVALLSLITVVAAAPGDLLIMAPADLLLVLLALGLSPGEDLVVWLATRRRPPARRRRRRALPRPRSSFIVRRVGATFAYALAMRPPPARAALIA